MTPFNLRSLLLAAIFLSNCISWTASRHHYTHNVNGHRSRHRRQGAGLFLSASYVLPGGEGNGWGEWGEVSPCSRTCGGGVASQKRICLQIGPDGQPQCTGGDTKFFSCQTQDCPAGSKDFRAEQCSEYDDQLFRDIKYRWVPYTKAPNPCELNCMPHAERFYYRHKAKVIDGTRCSDDSFDVCVNGTCQPVGCDMMLGSSAKEDKCRECRGNNANCHTTAGLLDTDDLRKGYNDMLLIPEGSTTIIIAEVAPSNNYLALRAKNGTFYLNGDYHIDFPRNLIIAGTLWSYERSQQGFAAPDKLRCMGPTNEPLYLSLLLQDENVGIDYEYSLPIDMAPPQNKRYNWVHDEFTPCSASCGGGFQTRTVTCRSREELDVVDEGLCDDGLRPPTNQSCNTQACDPLWVPSAWGQCSKRCGKGGTRNRDVTCQKIITNGYPSIVADKECFDLLGPKPELFQTCNENATCPTWFTGPWKPCDKLCDEGKQTRQVVCYQKNGRKIEVLADTQCEDERPVEEQSCTLQPCDGVDWVVSPWNGCDTCLSTIRTRTAVCATKNHVVVNDSFCAYHPTPSTKESCDPTLLPACQVQWYATQWSNCSVKCGKGVQTRKVFCGLFDGASVLKVDDKRCDGQPKYNTSKTCEIPKEQCPSQWFAGPWSACDKKCGGGEQFRRVMCLRGEKMATDCVEDPVPVPAQNCNTEACNDDELLPVDSNSALMGDDYEDCEDDQLYPEAGLDDADGTTLDDTMFSDDSSTVTDTGSGMWSTSFAELESNFTDTARITAEVSLDTTLSSDELLTTEGSGTGSTETLFTDDFTDSSSDETGSGSTTLTDATETTVSGASEATSSEDTESTEATVSSSKPSSDSVTESGTTDSTASTLTEETDSTVTYDLTTTDDSEESSDEDLTTIIATDTGSTETSETATSGSTEASESSTPGSTNTDETTITDATETSKIDTVSTETTVSEPIETTVSELTETTVFEPTGTTESVTTETSDLTTSSESSETTEPSDTTETGTSDASGTTILDTTEAPSTTESGTSEPSTTESSTSEPSTTESGTSEPSTTESGTSEPSTTESGTSKASGTTETGETTETGSTETTEVSATSESGTTEFIGSTEAASTEASEASVSDSTETTESGPTETSTTDETTVSVSTETTVSGSMETTETGSTEVTETGSTEITETGSTEITETGSTEITETGSTETTEIGSTDTSEAIETTSTEPTETTSSSDTERSGSTESSTTEVESFTSSALEWITSKKPRMCRPRNCNHEEFGCCPDRKTPAGGPFDEGCPKPETCKETKYGCCPDGVSPAPNPNHKGCPVPACKDTLFGCCLSDNKTPAEGNDQEGCPSPPPACKSSKFGCCKDEETEPTGPGKEGCPETTGTVPEDELSSSSTAVYEGCEKSEFGCCFDNTTEATGPDQQGCPCAASEFGCCLDGVSPAEGPEFEGCLKNCNSSAYGCCPDGKTPAHGPNREGCCLRSAFGCCPDNYNFARGPHLEGCGCQYSPYGCCPDNVTVATGYDNKGCGCSYSTYGCCPNGHTEASGPGFEGCACHTYQFGCCPDGVTIARGPDGQGCHCLQSKFKCCGDGETHATGPNQEGCDCSSSKYGCCPDGRTEATGPKFQGCTDAPEDKQSACGLKFARGPCRNYSVNWYFDTEYGGCSRFWYGGCEGNGNRFATKDECDDTCVRPPPKNACKLPQSKGACLSYNIRWYYDSQREACTNFAYGGCLGNNNNFETRELCQKQCEPEKTTEQCSLPIEQGSCAGNFPRWGFNQETRRCEQFTWGGCEGNPNRFNTEAACTLRCNPPGQPKPECSQPQEIGQCAETEAVWSFSQTENRCVPFYYTGCGGNGNRFTSLEACEDSCPSVYVPDKCTLPYETGNCAIYREKWYFDTKDQRCRQFYYGGCGGNANNFVSEQECQSECTPVPTTTTPRPTAPQLTTLEREDFCSLDVDAGPCNEFKTAWAFDSKTGRCKTFQYGGCGGNRNNFPDELYCQYYCKAKQDICQLPMLSGPCEDSQMRWFYDSSTDSCSQFTYGGCQGNDNRFETRDECENRCKTRPADVQPTTLALTTTTVDPRSRQDTPAGCAISPTLEACSLEQAGVVWYLNPSTHECISHDNVADGDNCRTSGIFKSQEGCERDCGAFRGIDVCAYPLDPGRCSNFVSKYFFNGTSGRCEEFAYGGCVGGPNRFSTELECVDICKPTVDPCKQQPDPGNCLARFELWYYDEGRDQCEQFIYGGCGGNDNRFESREECEGRCKQEPSGLPVSTPTTTQVTPQIREPECTTPVSLEPCGTNETVFYYDEASSSCRASDFGGCRHPNSYGTEEDCERRCGAFRGLDVCRAQVDPGPCRAAIPKYFFDAATGSCQEFTYGGCQGGPNRFSSIEECEEICKEVGPAPACLQEVMTGASCGTLPTRRWHYSPARADCLVFAYQGCGGNENNFVSYEECAELCNVIPPDTEEQASMCDRYSEECESLESTCLYGIKVTVASEGCQRCSCEAPSCEREKQDCEQIRCSYGIQRSTGENGCESCKCFDDPCSTANCSANEKCVASAYRDSTQAVLYSAHCVPDTDTNEVLPECEQVEQQCAQLACAYGVQRYQAGDGCRRCQCLQHPCADKQCGEGERCVSTPYRDDVSHENRYLADCRPVEKPGICPADNSRSTESTCRSECRDDADCRGVGKCCPRGCSRLCLVPEEPTTLAPAPQHVTTYRPDAPQAPQASTATEPEVAVEEGGKATLKCIFHGNPPPRITWRFGEITIDGDRDRYRLLSDGALEIVSLFRNDSGVYICVGENDLGTAQQEIRLQVNDPVVGPANIAGEANAVIVGELGRPLEVRCRAYGYPAPAIYWYRGINGPMVPYSNTLYEARGQILLIRKLVAETLGEYACYAYNGHGKPATWVVTVQAYQPDDNAIGGRYLVPQDRVVAVTPREPTPITTTSTTTTQKPEIETPPYIVEVQTQLLPASTTISAGTELSLPCNVDGYPEPSVTWTKDGVLLAPTDRMWITGTRLTIPRAAISDSGVYGCHAANRYSTHSSTVQINVQEIVIPSKCTDSTYFANCALIVQGKFCRHKYYSRFCCKSCVEAGQLDPNDVDMQADEPYKKKK